MRLNVSVIIDIILTKYDDFHLIKVDHDNISTIFIIIDIISKDDIKICLILIDYKI